MDVEVNWEEYFESIQTVCPWSYSSWQKGKIDIVYQTDPMPLQDFDARVYVVDIEPIDLNAYHEWLNDNTEDEWLWSHPEYAGNSAPVAILIQQDHKYLRMIRNKLLLNQKV